MFDCCSNRLFDSTGCAVLSRWGHGLADGPTGAEGGEKAGRLMTGMGCIAAKTTGESGSISRCVRTQNQHRARTTQAWPGPPELIQLTSVLGEYLVETPSISQPALSFSQLARVFWPESAATLPNAIVQDDSSAQYVRLHYQLNDN